VLIVVFVIWSLFALSPAVHGALSVFLAGGLLAVVSLQVMFLIRSDPSLPPPGTAGAAPVELAMRRKRLDPRRRPVVAYLEIAAIFFVVPTVILLGTASSEGQGTPLAQILNGTGLTRFVVIGTAVNCFGTFVWMLLSGSLEQMIDRKGPRPPWAVSTTALAGSSAPLKPPAHEAARNLFAPVSGDALGLVDCRAFAAVMADRIGSGLGPGFVVFTCAEDAIGIRYDGHESIIVLRIGRFRLEPLERAICLASQQVLSEAQHLASGMLGRPWPEREDSVGDLEATSVRSRVTEADGVVHLSWRDSLGTVLDLEPFSVREVLVTGD